VISPWLAPALSTVTNQPRRCLGGTAAIAASSSSTWSLVVFDPALPGRIIPASGSLILSQ